MRGWGNNCRGEIRRRKMELVSRLEEIDKQAELNAATSDWFDWKIRYEVEAQLVGVYAAEEVYWQKRRSEQWLLKGDANTDYFHKIANGRKRKASILSLEDDSRLITENEELREHITQYYKQLFRREVDASVHLAEDVWVDDERVSQQENQALCRPFSLKEIEAAIKRTETNTAPRPDGIPVQYYKEFWPQVKDLVKELMDELHAGRLNLGRLNYGVITLIPKLKGV